MIKTAIVLLSVLVLSGCMGATRPCPGFGTPLADKWDTGRDVGDVITYASESGPTIALKLTEREDSAPYEGSSHTGSDEVTCFSNSVRRYTFENTDVALRIKQAQTQFENPSREDAQSFNITIEPESTAVDAVAGFAYIFSLGRQARQQYTDTFDPDHSIELDPRVSRFIENLQINNSFYPYAVEQKFLDLARLNNVTNVNSFATITRVIVAEEGGLVQFELLNGEVYSRL